MNIKTSDVALGTTALVAGMAGLFFAVGATMEVNASHWQFWLGFLSLFGVLLVGFGVHYATDDKKSNDKVARVLTVLGLARWSRAIGERKDAVVAPAAAS